VEVTAACKPQLPCVASSSSSSKGLRGGLKGLRCLFGRLQRVGGKLAGALKGRGRQAQPVPAA
jgi:hypothetical protein